MSANQSSWNVRGSQWHRWDPHIHAPGTILNDQFGGDLPAYLQSINALVPEVHALGVTDYCSIETYKQVLQSKKDGGLPEVSLVFPNVEMRLGIKTDKGRGINLHLLFSPDDPKHTEEIERVLAQLTFEYNERTYRCAKSDLVSLGQAFDARLKEEAAAFSAGVNQFKVDWTQLRELFRKESWLRENCLVAVAAGLGDGMAALQNDDAFSLLREEVQRFAHAIFSGNPADRAFWLGEKGRSALEEKYRGLKPCLHGCDAHSMDKVGKPDGLRYCWIKGDLSFESLRQAVIEPEERVWIGEKPPVSPGDSVVIDAIKAHDMPWLANPEIALNSGLVAVIGARGSGKTALVDMIAVGGQALIKPLPESSFLYRATEPDDLIGGAEVEEVWKDNSSRKSAFSAIDRSQIEGGLSDVCYLSQQFVDRLCSAEGLAGELRKEIERVIFEQTDPACRYETDSFTTLSEFLLEPIHHRRDQQLELLETISHKIADEQRLNEILPKLMADKTSLETTLGKQRKDLADLMPKDQAARAKRFQEVEEACTEHEAKVDNLRRQAKALDELLQDANYERTSGEPRRFAELQERFRDAALTPEDWKAFRQVFVGDVDAAIKQRKSQTEQARAILERGNPVDPVDLATAAFNVWPLVSLRAERDNLKKQLGVDAAKQKKYDALKRSIGTNERSHKKYTADIKAAEGSVERRKALQLERQKAYQIVFDALVEEQKALEGLYQPLHGQLAGATGALRKLKFLARRRIDLDGWVARGEKLLDLRKETVFRGQGALKREVTQHLLPAWRSGTPDKVAAAMSDFVEKFSVGLLKAMPPSIQPDGVIGWRRELGEWLFSADHIKIEYGMEYDGTVIEKLSPGTRGIVLLLLFLAIDVSDRRPLLIDQPEENLDPQSVFQDLVPHFREARKRRQVIIVTHNANLVVNTDADQVIVASAQPTQLGSLPTISYAAGSLENPSIRQSVCDILEGGKRAFLERERRYRLQWEGMLEDTGSTQAQTR